jgi:fucose 4-O-acetylase-like acetyltransferase
MPLFMFISGYFFSIHNNNLFIFCKEKILRLLISAIVMTPFVWLAQYLFHGTDGNLKGVLIFIINDFWFLKSLFICIILVFIILKYCKKNLFLLLPFMFMIIFKNRIPYYVAYMYPFLFLVFFLENII